MKNHFLHRFFNPRSVAIVGATSNKESINYQLIGNLLRLGYTGRIYPVNPRGGHILGLKCYKSVNDIDGHIDLMAISVPERNVPGIIKELDGRKVSGVAIISGGFSEAGDRGRRSQEEIAALLKQKGIRAIGPNILGPVNSHSSFAISFATLNKLAKGNVSFIFQSGMYEPRFSGLTNEFHLKLSKIIDLGNKMDITEVDALEYLLNDADTEAIFIHLEMIKGDGRRFFQLLKETTRLKPVVLLKGGRTEAGAAAAMSHTGSLARQNDAVFDAALRQAGVIRVDTLDDFLYLAKAFGYLPLPRSNRVAMATFPGGEAVLASDLCSQQGLVMAKPSKSSYEKLRKVFPAWDIRINPFDLGVVYTFHSDNNNHASFIETMSEDEGVDCLAVQLPPPFFPFKADDLCPRFTVAAERGKPLVVWPASMSKRDDEFIDYLEERSVPVFPSYSVAIKCLAALNRYARWRESRFYKVSKDSVSL